jgi:hypothetical protein
MMHCSDHNDAVLFFHVTSDGTLNTGKLRGTYFLSVLSSSPHK